MAKNEEFIRILNLIRFKYNLNQEEIAQKIGVSKQYLSDVKNGRYQFSDDLKQKIYECFTYISEQQSDIPTDDNNSNVGRFLSLLEKKDEQIDRLITLLEKEAERTEVIVTQKRV